MAPPAVTIYTTSLTSAPKVRQGIELLRRSLNALEIPYTEYDLVNEPEAKTRWQRAKPPGMVVGLPGYLVGGEWVGTMDDYESAVEGQYLPSFLKQDLDLGAAGAGDGASGIAGADKSVGEAELEKLMREMTTEDLDKLAAEVGVETSSGVGLLVPEGSIPTEHVEPEQDAMDTAKRGNAGLDSADNKGEVEELDEPSFESKVQAVRKGIMGTPSETPPLDLTAAPEVGPGSQSGSRSASGSDAKGILDGIATAAAGVTQTVKSAAENAASQVKDGIQEIGTVEKASDTPALTRQSAEKERRLSKEEIAREIQNAGSVDDILEALNKADGSADRAKEKVE